MVGLPRATGNFYTGISGGGAPYSLITQRRLIVLYCTCQFHSGGHSSFPLERNVQVLVHSGMVYRFGDQYIMHASFFRGHYACHLYVQW